MAIPATIGVGVLINQLMDSVNQIVLNARNAGLLLEMEGGAQLRKTIEQAKVAYSELLNETMDRVDQTVRDTFNNLNTLVVGAQQRNATLMQNMAERAQTIANTLPLHNDRPQLSSVVPRYVYRNTGDDTPILFQLFGNFEHAPQAAYAPTLEFGARVIQPSSVAVPKLEFRVTPSDIFPAAQANQTARVIFAEGVLKVKWPGTVFGVNEAAYRVLIGKLPATPGTIQLTHVEKYKENEERPYTSPQMVIGSCREEGNNDVIDYPFKATPSEGWKIKRGTTKAEEWGQGERKKPSWHSEDETQVVYLGSTIHKVAGSSGRMHVTIKFTEYREVKKEKTVTEDISLNWRDTRSIVPEKNWKGWQVDFQAFDGSSHQFIGSDLTSSPYIKIESQGSGFIIKATKPAELEGL